MSHSELSYGRTGADALQCHSQRKLVLLAHLALSCFFSLGFRSGGEKEKKEGNAICTDTRCYQFNLQTQMQVQNITYVVDCRNTACCDVLAKA